MMDLMGMPYTHSGLATSVIAIDKELTKHALVPHGIPMPGGRIVRSEELYEGDPLARPYVLKPVNEGSSVGVAIVTAEGNYGNPISRDANGPVAAVRQPACRALHPRPRADRGGARRPRADGHRAGAQERLLRFRRQVHRRDDRARLPGADPRRDRPSCASTTRSRRTACSAAAARSRSDFRWDDERGEDGLFLLETNTQPGMTPLSLVPEQARHCGIDYGELVEIIIEDALAPLRQAARHGGARLMAQTIRRKATGGPPPGPLAGHPATKVRQARQKTNSLIDALMRCCRSPRSSCTRRSSSRSCSARRCSPGSSPAWPG